MKKLDLYIIRKFLGTFFFAILIIISISIVFDIAEHLDEFLDKEAPVKEIILDHYLNFIPYFVNLFSALFIFIAVIFFTSKLASNTEIIAILSSGISFRRMLLPYFISALFLGIFSFVLSSYIIPPANAKRLAFENKYLRNAYRNFDKNIHKQILPGVYMYMESYNNNSETGYKFALEKFEDDKLVSKMRGDYVRWDTIKNKWDVNNYYIRNIEGEIETIERGARIDTTLNILPKDFASRTNIVETMNYNELNAFIDKKKLQGDERISFYLIEKYRRIANPFSTFILTLIGVSLATRKTRGGIGLHLGIGILLSFLYILFMQMSINFATGGTMNPILAVWLPNIIFGVIAIFLYRLAPK